MRRPYAGIGFPPSRSLLPPSTTVGLMYDNGNGVPEDDAEAVRWFRLSAEQGFAAAQYNLGVMYGNGDGVPEDAGEAVRLELGFPPSRGMLQANTTLSVKYAHGYGVPEDDAEAVRWYRLAAEQEYASAQFDLGVMYSRGEGVPEDDAEAVRWYRLAAEQGDALAQTNLGLMYANGDGVLQDPVLAYMWFDLSAAQGNETAQSNKDVIEQWLSREQIAEARRLSREWTETCIPRTGATEGLTALSPFWSGVEGVALKFLSRNGEIILPIQHPGSRLDVTGRAIVVQSTR